jgi:hypothetical protein
MTITEACVLDVVEEKDGSFTIKLQDPFDGRRSFCRMDPAVVGRLMGVAIFGQRARLVREPLDRELAAGGGR